MTGHRPFDELRTQMRPERRARNDEATSVLLQELDEGQQATTLSDRDSQTFARAMTTPIPVNDRLRDTVRRYRETTGT